MKKLFKNILLFLLLCLTLSVSGNAWFENKADEEQQSRGLSEISANAIKHAYAANSVYNIVRKTGISAALAENITIRLGILSEAAENTIKIGEFADSGLEIMKDLHNNMVGITAARWMEHNLNKNRTSLEVIGELAENQVLIINRNDLEDESKPFLLDKKLSNLPKATEWFFEAKEDIFFKTNAYLATM